MPEKGIRPPEIDFRTALAAELPAQGLIPVEHVTSGGTRYLMYVLPGEDELPYVHDPSCGYCGCPRTSCYGAPERGWDDLVPEDICQHESGNGPGGAVYSCAQ